MKVVVDDDAAADGYVQGRVLEDGDVKIAGVIHEDLLEGFADDVLAEIVDDVRTHRRFDQ